MQPKKWGWTCKSLVGWFLHCFSDGHHLTLNKLQHDETKKPFRWFQAMVTIFYVEDFPLVLLLDSNSRKRLQVGHKQAVLLPAHTAKRTLQIQTCDEDSYRRPTMLMAHGSCWRWSRRAYWLWCPARLLAFVDSLCFFGLVMNYRTTTSNFRHHYPPMILILIGCIIYVKKGSPSSSKFKSLFSLLRRRCLCHQQPYLNKVSDNLRYRYICFSSAQTTSMRHECF